MATNGTTDATFTYQANGLTATALDGLNDQWTWSWSGADLLSASDPLLHSNTLAYGNPAQPHVPTSDTDALNHQWVFGLNAYGQVTSATPPAGSPTAASIFGYDETVGSPTRGYPLVATDGNGDSVTAGSYDALGDLTQIVTYPVHGDPNTWISTGFTYDAAQRLTLVSLPDGKTIQSIYAGRNLDHTIDPAGTQINYGYCGVCGALTDISGPLGWSLHTTLDADKLQTAFTDARSHTTQYVYGLADELKQVLYPDNTSEAVSYDAKGRPGTVTNGRNQQIVPSYDAADRISGISFPTTGAPSIGMTYYADGSPQTMTDASGTTSWFYFADGSLQTVLYNYAASGLANAQQLDYTYYPDGSRSSLTWHNGAALVGTWNYGYDAGGRLTSVANPWNETTTWGYDGEGKLKTQTNQNGTSLALTYNELRGWPIQETWSKSGTPFASYALTYDLGSNTVGNLTGVSELDGSTVQYRYDALYRLTSAVRTGTYPYSQTYTLDLGGNITKINNVTFASYDAANKLQSPYGGSAAYDGDGNLISTSYLYPSTFSWDDRSQLTGYSYNSAPASFGCDGAGRLVWSQPGTGVKTFHIFDGDLVLGEVQSNGSVPLAYTWGADGVVSARSVPNHSSFWYHFGPSGECRQLTTSAGAVTASCAYTAYGLLYAGTSASWNPFGFRGQAGCYTDLGTSMQLIHCGARWYNPRHYRWLSRDPIGYAGGDNLYVYCGGNPVGLVDADGTDCESLAREIKRHRDELQRRYDQMRFDEYPGPGGLSPLNLYRNRPNDVKGRSWQGEQQQFANKQRHLRKLLKDWHDGGCDDPPPGEKRFQIPEDAWKQASREAPRQPLPYEGDSNLRDETHYLVIPLVAARALAARAAGGMASGAKAAWDWFTRTRPPIQRPPIELPRAARVGM